MPDAGTGLLIVTVAAPTNAVGTGRPSSWSTAGIERQVNILGAVNGLPSRRGWAAATGLLTPRAAALRARGRACGRSDMRIVPGAVMSRARWSGRDHAAAATTSTLEEPAARWSARELGRMAGRRGRQQDRVGNRVPGACVHWDHARRKAEPARMRNGAAERYL